MIASQDVIYAIKDLSYKANFVLPVDVQNALKFAYNKEKNLKYKQFIYVLLKNAEFAKIEALSLCQDTGIPLLFFNIGSDHLNNIPRDEIIKNTIMQSYRENYLRNSIINDPLIRNKVVETVPIIYYEFSRGNRLKISMLIRGAGCENTTRLKMFSPDEELAEIEKFIINAVQEKILYACPPVTVGVGIGGDASKAVLLSKKAFLKKLSTNTNQSGSNSIDRLFIKDCRTNKDISAFYKKLENNLLKKINNLRISIFGKPVTTICLGVFIEHIPCHIASLPIAVSLQCHSYRRWTKEII